MLHAAVFSNRFRFVLSFFFVFYRNSQDIFAIENVVAATHSQEKWGKKKKKPKRNMITSMCIYI